ncbi:E3 SUMO-protein ligase ZBED1-like [Epinephelus lanceolatus]
MCKALNPKYNPPSRSYLSDTLIPSWYDVEKANLISELKDVPKLAISSDGWTSLSQDHYITVTVHYTSQGKLKQRVLHTRAVYQSQTGEVVAEEISDILEEFKIELSKVCAVTVDNAGNLDVAIRKLGILKIGCFAHTLNVAAQKIYTVASIDKWAAQIRSVVVWFKRSSVANTVLKDKQQILGLKQHSLILDVKTRWNSLYLMIKRFMEQYPAIQAAALDPQLRRAMTKDNLDRLRDDDFHKAEEFVQLMKILYTSTLCVSGEKNSTCGQIIPILQKLEEHFTVKHEDTSFVTAIKEKDNAIQDFLHEATAMDPRFKGRPVSEDTWDRLRKAVIDHATGAATPEESEGEETEHLETDPPQSVFKAKSALEELFAEEERELRSTIQQSTMSLPERVDQEVELYKGLPAISMAEDPVMWWWEKKDILPLLFIIATGYLCTQASSTPSERVFSTAGNTISQERSRLLPEKVDMLIFLQKNC